MKIDKRELIRRREICERCFLFKKEERICIKEKVKLKDPYFLVNHFCQRWMKKEVYNEK